MHIITQRRIWQAKANYPKCSTALDGWYRVMKKNNFDNFADLKNTFNSMDKVNDTYIFDIGGNKLRLIANIYFNRRKVYIRDVLSHKEYNKNKWIK